MIAQRENRVDRRPSGGPAAGLASRRAPSDRELARALAAATAELEALRREQAKLQQAVYEAAQMQRKLCAPRELLWGPYEIAGEIFPVRHLSGDFFKVMDFGSSLGLAVGDIAGKGLTAGIWQTHLMALTQGSARRHADPAAALAEINRGIWQEQGEPPLTAVFLGRLDPVSNELAYCNAGLPAPLLLRDGKAVERLETGGPMLGALEQAAYSSGRIRLDPGDMLVAYSDGATECRNAQDQEFETARLAAAAGAVSGAGANQALFSTLAAVLDFAAACPPEDDLTLLVVRRRGIADAERGPRNKDFSLPRREASSVPRPKRASRSGNGSNS
jgi:sigma-B regulation protein RsbU (phosphoserine phosphatase)